MSEHLVDMYADLMITREQLLDSYEKAKGQEADQIAERIEQISKVLGDEDDYVTTDELVDEWEREFEQGRVPDLDKE